MSSITPESRLTGGLVADVTRAGNTVRRSRTDATDTIHRLLNHLRSRGFTQVPEPLGFDPGGREILTYVQGRAGHPPVPPAIASDDALASAARTIRAFHDASEGFVAQDWNTGVADPSGIGEVICHNDLAPFNLIYRASEVAAIIDWDTAAPGRRVWDLAYAAWRLVPLHRPEYAEPLGWPALDRARRLQLFADAYGVSAADRRQMLDIAGERIRRTVEGIRDLVTCGRAVALRSGDPRAEAGDLPYLASHLDEWRKALVTISPPARDPSGQG